jgi:hypothetical protein
MKPSTHDFDAQHRLYEESVARVARNHSDDSIVSDDDIPWDEIMADLSSGVQGIPFEPEDLLKWMEEGQGEE